MIGQTISHYRIVEKLGEGGMGVVYKAEDTQLRRTVALKFLTPQALNESETKARLIREAQAAASLDHPNICNVHGIHEEGGHTFIAMAYVDGMSLADKIKQRPLAFEEALNIAIQIGEGLQEAHEKGVVHRDIKPANIMLTRKDRVKIMDFGLAYLAGRSKLTKSGTTLGTPVYMSPEQALGQPADRRSDIWSLGVVLYEMIAGQPPFNEEHEQAIVYSILNEAPEPLTARRTGLPVEIDRVIAKVLAKKPDERYQHVDDLAVDLKNLREKPKSGASAVQPVAPAPPVAPHVEARGGKRIFAAWLAAAVLGVIAIAGWAAYLLRPPPPPAAEVRFSIQPPQGSILNAVGSQSGYPLLSPDGSQLLFGTSRGTYIRHLSSLEPLLLGPASFGHASFSPDGRWLARTNLAGVQKRLLPDGPWQTVTTQGTFSRGISWGSRGWMLVGGSNVPQAVEAEGGEMKPVFEGEERERWSEARWPQFLPDGENFLFTGFEQARDQWGIYLSRLRPDGRAEATALLLANPGSARFSPVAGGQLFFVQGSRLYAQKLNLSARRLEGQPRPVVEEVAWSPAYALSYFDVAPDGTVAWRPGTSSQSQLTWVDRQGQPLATTGPAATFFQVLLSPDGQRAVGHMFGVPREAWLMESGQAGYRKLAGMVFDRPVFYRWGNDSKTLLTTVFAGAGKSQLVEQSALPDAEQRVLAVLPGEVYLSGISRDGRDLLLASGPDQPFLYRLDGRSALTPLGAPGERIYNSGFSPDGQWILFRIPPHIFVQSRDLISPRRQISTAGASFPIWRLDGKEILFVQGGKLTSVAVDTSGGQFRAADPVALFDIQIPPHAVTSSKPFDVTADGSRILIEKPLEQPGSGTIHVAKGWQTLLE